MARAGSDEHLGADRQVADPPSGGVVDGVRDRGCDACRGQLAEAFDAVAGDKRSLQRMKPALPGDALDRRTCLPAQRTASVRQLRTRRPSTCTVQAPQAPWSQPFFVPVRSSRSRSTSSRLSRGSTSRVYSRSLTVRCSARAIPVSWRSVMSMPSTVALNWMIEHHIIHTISGHDHRPARPSAPLRPTREDDVTPERTGSFLAARRRAMIKPWGLLRDRVSRPAGTRTLVR